VRKILLLLVLVAVASPALAQYPVAVHTSHYPHISNMSAWYGAVSLELAGNRAGICNWGSNLFDYLVSYNANGGAFCENINGKVYIVLYIEGSDVTANPNVTNHIADFYNLQTFAVANGFVMEQMLIHQSQDYNHNIWTQRDKFDVFDNGKGCFTSVSGVFTDVTTQMYSGASNTTVSDTLYCGFMEPYDQWNIVLATARVGGTATFQYWNGSAWSALTPHTDGTSGLTASGQMYFYPPSDWAQTSVNGSNQKFWVRVVVAGQSTSPVITTNKGDTQLTGGLNRGWAAGQPPCPGNTPNGTSCFINSGRLLYNANPPAGQTAHFLQQGRSANFNNSYTLMNPSDIQGGIRTMAPWLETFLTGTPEGVMFDDAPNWPTDDRLANMIEITTDAAWVTNKNAVFTKIASDWHTSFGSHFLVGGNAQTHVAVCYVLDWCYAESTLYTSYAPQQEEPNSFDYTVNGSTTYDAMLTVNNAANIPASEMCYDWPNSGSNSYVGSLGNTGIYNTGTHYWDRGQRGPITCLAQHYLAANSNTGFSYHNQGSFNYNLTDEVYVYGPATTITSTITQGMAPGTITIASAAGCTPFDYNNFGYLRVGTTSAGDTFYGTISGTTFTTTTTAANSYSSGNEAHCVQSLHQAQGAVPQAGSVFLWATWFPAMAVDVGVPNASGLGGGARVMPWKTGGSPDCISGLVCTGGAQTNCDNTGGSGDFAGRCANLHRRDYTKAIILYRDKKFPTKNVELDTYSQPINLSGTYYPLRADGTTGPAITSIQLRGSEGAILMISPITTPPAPAPTMMVKK
jgi:hypothetical protein